MLIDDNCEKAKGKVLITNPHHYVNRENFGNISDGERDKLWEGMKKFSIQINFPCLKSNSIVADYWTDRCT